MNTITSTPSAASHPGVDHLTHHPMVQAACQVATPVVRGRALMPWSKGDPDRMVMVSCLVSFLVLPFVL